MFSQKPDVYEKVYRGLVEQLETAPLPSNAASLALDMIDDTVIVPFFGRDYRVGPTGVDAVDGSKATVSHRIVLAHYLLQGGSGGPAGRFVPYRELPGGMDFARNLAVTVEGRIADRFTGRWDALRRAGRAIGGREIALEVSCDVALEVPALPQVSMRLTYYDADDDFPAEAKVFYDRAATTFLDLECLAVLGSLLGWELDRSTGRA